MAPKPRLTGAASASALHCSVRLPAEGRVKPATGGVAARGNSVKRVEVTAGAGELGTALTHASPHPRLSVIGCSCISHAELTAKKMIRSGTCLDP
jgi:hypothetical protein